MACDSIYIIYLQTHVNLRAANFSALCVVPSHTNTHVLCAHGASFLNAAKMEDASSAKLPLRTRSTSEFEEATSHQ